MPGLLSYERSRQTSRGTKRLQVKTFNADVFPTVNRTIFKRRPYDYVALAPVLRAATALMLLHQARLETLKIGEANDPIRL
jgi:hypothetical protein